MEDTMTIRNIQRLTLGTLIAGVIGFAGTAAQADLLVYEGFQYSNVGDPLDAVTTVDTDATGLTGSWSDAGDDDGNEMFLKNGSLIHSNLPVSGNSIGYLSNSDSDIMVRNLDGTAQAGIGGTSTIYISFLFEKLQNNFGADHEGMALMNGNLPQARWDSGNAGAVGRHGFAIAATANSNLRAVAYDGTTGARIDGTQDLPISVGPGGDTLNGPNVVMVLGEISFNTGTGGADVFKLYNVADDGTLDAGDLTLIDTIEADVDESTLSTLNLTRQVNVNYDEVRITTTLPEALGIPEPASVALIGLGGLVMLARRR
jgi:hypothetical protein